MCTGDMHKPFGPSLHLCAPLSGALTGPKTQDSCVRRVKLKQGSGNIMPDLSNQVLFHLGQVRNFNLLDNVLGEV